MKTIAEVVNDCRGSISVHLGEARRLVVGKDVRLTGSAWPARYRGRLGRITDVVVNETAGMLFLVMVYRIGTREFLNSNGWTRSYRPLSDFYFWTEEIVVPGEPTF